MPNMGVYNVSKHAVVSLSETLYQDLRLVSERVHAHVLAPYFVPTGIAHSERARPQDAQEHGRKATTSQRVAQGADREGRGRRRASRRPTSRSSCSTRWRPTASTSTAIPRRWRRCITRAEDIVSARNPSDPYRERPELGDQLRAALRR